MSATKTIGCVDEETRKRTRETVSITPETWGGVRLIRLVIERPDAHTEARVSQVYIKAGEFSADFGHAIVNASYGEPLDQSVEPWARGELMTAERFEHIQRLLQDPRATSAGHKRTIRVARDLADEVERLRAKLAPIETRDRFAIVVWHFHDAPEELRALSRHGGDEDWIALVPAGVEAPAWADSGTAFGCCDVSEHRLEDGRLVLIGAHA